VTTSVAVVAVAAMISGVAGVVVGGAAVGVRYSPASGRYPHLRSREKLCEAVTVGLAAGGLTLAGAVLSQNPWRSVDGYAGHSAGVQLLALVSVAMLAASTVSTRGRLAADSQAERELMLEDPPGSHTQAHARRQG
jgi:arabinofuranan 3-O-arabinosyltransferase